MSLSFLRSNSEVVWLFSTASSLEISYYSAPCSALDLRLTFMLASWSGSETLLSAMGLRLTLARLLTLDILLSLVSSL